MARPIVLLDVWSLSAHMHVGHVSCLHMRLESLRASVLRKAGFMSVLSSRIQKLLASIYRLLLRSLRVCSIQNMSLVRSSVQLCFLRSFARRKSELIFTSRYVPDL